MITAVVNEDFMTGDKTIVVKVPKVDLVELKLDPFDRAVLDTPHENVADLFQDLELLSRRLIQQATPKEGKS